MLFFMYWISNKNKNTGASCAVIAKLSVSFDGRGVSGAEIVSTFVS